MIRSRAVSAVGLVGVTVGCGLASAAPATAGGVGDLLSPAFGTSCANMNTGARANGVTRQGTGTAGGNLAGVPVGSALNQCGGADAPIIQDLLMDPCKSTAIKVQQLKKTDIQKGVVNLNHSDINDLNSSNASPGCIESQLSSLLPS